ncbi:diacylglycerol kinase family protein [Candidatus Chlorohelix sp.]|uniref:diacylglycerol/lipid kinase family protein n=1 Tax=Candidatus Chlorohelix sp. TaxID=3139201 RepID=UPI003037DA74
MKSAMKIFIIYNPTAGSARRFNRLSRLIHNLSLMGHSITLYPTRFGGEATELANRAIAEGAEVVVAVGGDGTVNEIVQAMAGKRVPLAVYPSGTTNVWCQQINMPVNPRLASEVISNGVRRQVDLGYVDGRYFLLMLGIGFDGEVVKGINPGLKQRVGKLAYVVSGLKAINYRARDVSLTLETGESFELHQKYHSSMLIFTNSERYAVLKIAHEAQVDDGALNLLVFEDYGFISKIKRAISLALNRTEQDPRIARFAIKSAKIELKKPAAGQIDGDFWGQCGPIQLEIRCVPGALAVIVPHDAPGNIFAN